MKTERLYYTDSYLREFEAQIVGIAQAGAGFRVYLDRTAFYPESGGQPADRGRLGEVPLLNVENEGEAVAHLLGARPADGVVRGVIDWKRRFDHMQQHTGQHILSAAFEKRGDYKTVSFHMGDESSTIDLDSDRVSRPQVQAAEESANEVVFEDRPVKICFKSEEETSAMKLRKPSERKGEVRLVEIADFDLSACGGTHVSRTGAVGLILVRKMDHTKGMTRVEFVCGGRALRKARNDYLTLADAALELSAPLVNVPALARKRGEELRESLRIREKLLGQLAEYRARELFDSAPVKNGLRIVRKAFAAGEIPEIKHLINALAGFPAMVALVGVRGRPAGLYFAQSRGGGCDMAALLKRVTERFGGKGGGTRDSAQGGGLEESRIEDALILAESLLAGDAE
jgi:alanyl-tRNA synthetase